MTKKQGARFAARVNSELKRYGYSLGVRHLANDTMTIVDRCTRNAWDVVVEFDNPVLFAGFAAGLVAGSQKKRRR